MKLEALVSTMDLDPISPSMETERKGLVLRWCWVWGNGETARATKNITLSVEKRYQMMLFPGLWFSHGGQVVSLDLVSQPSQVLTMARVQILRPYCSPTHYLVPPGCSSLLNPFSCCSEEPMCNTTGVCISGFYWCHLLESCLPVTSPCSPYHSSAAGLVFPLPPRYTAVPPFYHMMADVSLKILPASEPVHFRVTFVEKGISVYPDDIIAVQHSRKAGEFLHCVSSSDSAWRQSYLSLPGPELGGWVEVGVSVPADGCNWVDNVVCDLQLIYEDYVLVYGVPPVLSSTQSDLRIETTTPTTHLVKPQTPVSGLHVLYPVLDKENQIHLPVNVQTIIIIKILSGHNATSAWSAPVFRTGIPFQLSCPLDMSEIQAVCERDTPDMWFSYVYVKLSAQGEQTLNITASNTLNTQMLSIKLQAHIPVTGLSVQPRGFHRVLVDIPQEFKAAVATGSSVKYTWITDNLVKFAYTGQTYNVVFKKQGEYMLKVMAENPVSSQFLELKLTADVMAPLANLTVLSKKEAIAVSTPNIYTLRVKLDISIGVTIRWDFGDSSTCVNHTFSAPLERSNTSLDQTAIQIYLQDSVLHTYTTPGDYTLRIEAENKYDHIKKVVPIKVRSPLTRVLISSMPTVPKVNQSILFEASSLPSSYGILYLWNFGDGSQELKGPYKVSHAFKAAGVYNVSVCSNNTLSQMIAWMSLEVVETISGVHLSYNGPSELNSVTEIYGRVSTGTSLRWTFELGDGSVFKDLSKSSISHIYKSVGNYTAQVTVSNAVSKVRQPIDVEIYQLAINGIWPSGCIVSGEEVILQAVVTGNGSSLTFHWSFGDGTLSSVKTGTSTIAHTFSGPRNYLIDLTVYSHVGSVHYQATVCVEALITELNLHSALNAVAVDEEICFDALWDFGDSDDVVKITKSNTVDHKYKVKGRFVVHVTVFNNVSQVSAQLPVVVRKLECTQPRVSLIQDQPKILRATPNYFEASVELSGCVSYKTTYLWEIYHDPNCTEKKVSLDSSVDVATPLLSLPKQILEVGDYCLKFSARFQGTPLHHHQTTKISVVSSPLVPIIKGGSHRMWSSQNDLILDGTESYDPDSAANDDLLQLQWDFKVLQDSTTSRSSRSFFPDQIIQHNSSSLILPHHILEPGSVYQFTLTVQKDGRPSVSTKQYVKIYEEEMIPVAVKCVSCSLHFSSYVSHSHPTALAGHCALCNGTVEFKWTAENSLGDVLHLNEVTTSTGDRAPILVIRPDVLMAGSEYIFTLNVSQSITGLWGSASIALKLNHPPHGGSCTLSPDHSVQLLQDMVSFSCSGWLNEDRECAQMIFSLQVAQCEDPGPQCPLITLYRGTQHTFRTLVPLGSARMRDNASIITIIVQVEDHTGAKVTALRRNLEVVLPMNDQGTTEWLKIKSQSELPALLQQGNPQDVIQYSTALISQLNQLEAMSGQDFEDRMQMRGNVTQALASLSVSSLQDAAQISSALAHSTAVPSELQCGDCHSRLVATTQKMIKVIREQTKQGDVTPIDTGRNILNVLSNSMTAAQKSKDILGANYHYKHQDISETAVSALQQVGELMRSLMWSRMPGEEALSLKAPHISAVGIRADPASNLLCTEESSHCQFHIPAALSSKLSKERKEVLQVLLVMKTERHPFVTAADPPISTTLAAMEFGTPQGQPITIANLTSDSAIHVTLHRQDMDMSPRVNVTLSSEGSVNFTVKAVEMYPNAGLFITFNFSLFQGSGQINSGRVNISVSYQQGPPLSQHSLNLSLSTDVPSVEDTIFLTPLLNGSSRELYVTLNSSLSGAEVCVSVCVFSSLCQFFNVEQRRWSTDGLNVLSSSSPNTADCLTQHLTLFGASLFVHPDAILLLPPVRKTSVTLYQHDYEYYF
ncbi:hypothetical protein MHYP_G00166070 [Metynnis hypsauchen]